MDLPEGAKVITSTCNGTYQSRLNARGFEQVAEKYSDHTSMASTMTKNTTIRIVLVLMLLAY